jgi:hypothetical protein
MTPIYRFVPLSENAVTVTLNTPEELYGFVRLNPEHSIEEIQALKVRQGLSYSTGDLMRLEDAEVVNIGDATKYYTEQADGAPGPYCQTHEVYHGVEASQSLTCWKSSLWYDYTNQAWVKDGVYQTCGHDKSRPCSPIPLYDCDPADVVPGFSYNCYGRLHAGETPAQSIIERYCNVQEQEAAKAEISKELSTYDAAHGIEKVAMPDEPEPFTDKAAFLARYARAKELGLPTPRLRSLADEGVIDEIVSGKDIRPSQIYTNIDAPELINRTCEFCQTQIITFNPDDVMRHYFTHSEAGGKEANSQV